MALISTGEAAKRLDCTRSWVNMQVRLGRIKAKSVKQSAVRSIWFIDEKEIARLKALVKT